MNGHKPLVLKLNEDNSVARDTEISVLERMIEEWVVRVDDAYARIEQESKKGFVYWEYQAQALHYGLCYLWDRFEALRASGAMD